MSSCDGCGSGGLSLGLPHQELIDVIRQVEAQLSEHSHELLEIMGEFVLTKVREDYATKSRGETGEDGVKWAPLQTTTILPRNRSARIINKPVSKVSKHPIGINSGRQQASLDAGNAGSNTTYEASAVVVGATMAYSPHFDQRRPIFPETLPGKWLEELQEQVADFAESVMIQKLDQIGN